MKSLTCPHCGAVSDDVEFMATQPLQGEQSYIVHVGAEGLLLEAVQFDVAPSSQTVELWCGRCHHGWRTQRPVQDWSYRP